MARRRRFRPWRGRAGERRGLRRIPGHRPRLRWRRLGRGRCGPGRGARCGCGDGAPSQLRPAARTRIATRGPALSSAPGSASSSRWRGRSSAAGNVQAEAREARYAAAERLRLARGLEWVATGHTRTDLAETVLYRLVTSPGRRALLGLRAQRGAIVRPMLAVERDLCARLVDEAGLPFRDDPTNAEPLYARNRIRNEVLPVLREIGPEAEATIAETQAELPRRREALERLAADAARRIGAPTRAGAIGEGCPRADWIRRSGGWRCAGWRRRPRAAGAARPDRGRRRSGGSSTSRRAAWSSSAAAWRLGSSTATSASRRAASRAGGGDAGGSRHLPLRLAGRCARSSSAACQRRTARTSPSSIRRRSASSVTVRSWREGDRMRPLGLGGTKSLQDLFTDRKVPRSLRHALPVVDLRWPDRLDRRASRCRRNSPRGPTPTESAVLRATQIGSIDSSSSGSR